MENKPKTVKNTVAQSTDSINYNDLYEAAAAEVTAKSKASITTEKMREHVTSMMESMKTNTLNLSSVLRVINHVEKLEKTPEKDFRIQNSSLRSACQSNGFHLGHDADGNVVIIKDEPKPAEE